MLQGYLRNDSDFEVLTGSIQNTRENISDIFDDEEAQIICSFFPQSTSNC